MIILDDEKDIRNMLGLIMGNFGFEVSGYESIGEAKTAIYDRQFDLALVDLHLGDGTGFDFIEEFKKRSAESDVIIISAYDSQEERKKAKELNVQHFVSKPFTKKVLKEHLKLLGYNI